MVITWGVEKTKICISGTFRQTYPNNIKSGTSVHLTDSLLIFLKTKYYNASAAAFGGSGFRKMNYWEISR